MLWYSHEYSHGFPLRPGAWAALYMNTGCCKYVGTCRYHHPLGHSTEDILNIANDKLAERERFHDKVRDVEL